jgi:hypothetical protein
MTTPRRLLPLPGPVAIGLAVLAATAVGLAAALSLGSSGSAPPQQDPLDMSGARRAQMADVSPPKLAPVPAVPRANDAPAARPAAPAPAAPARAATAVRAERREAGDEAGDRGDAADAHDDGWEGEGE